MTCGGRCAAHELFNAPHGLATRLATGLKVKDESGVANGHVAEGRAGQLRLGAIRIHLSEQGVRFDFRHVRNIRVFPSGWQLEIGMLVARNIAAAGTGQHGRIGYF